MAGADPEAALTLAAVPGLGPIGYARLVSVFGDAARVLSAGEKQLRETGGAREALVRAIVAARPDALVKAALEGARKANARVLPLEDAAYPARLRQIADPPSVIYLKGALPEAAHPAVAVVGSRRMTPYGRHVTTSFCRSFCRVGVAVISGMALGVDGQAHRVALGASGITVAVLGTGIDRPYPVEHAALLEQVAGSGAVVTEYAPGTGPLGPNFPRRNRIISGLAMGVLVVEADVRSGSLITARLAAEQGRDVFAVPGNVDQPGAGGTNALIRDGAIPVTCAGDVLADIAPQLALPEDAGADAPVPAGLGAAERLLLAELGSAPVSADILSERTGTPASVLLGTLLSLELAGLAERLPGNLYARVSGGSGARSA
ncbi:MAG: DNA-processing protein DprA [Leptospirillia bacterium]